MAILVISDDLTGLDNARFLMRSVQEATQAITKLAASQSQEQVAELKALPPLDSCLSTVHFDSMASD
jgi:hypothetical protein